MARQSFTLHAMVVILRDYKQVSAQQVAELFHVNTESVRRLRRGESLMARKAAELAKVPASQLERVMQQQGEEEARGKEKLPEIQPVAGVKPLSQQELDAMAQRLLAMQQQRELNGGV